MFRRLYYLSGPMGLAVLMWAAPAYAEQEALTDTRVNLPTAEALWRLLTLSDYNTRIVVLGCVFLGLAAGFIGPFMMMRKRSLMADAVSHATLPGVGLAFITMVAYGGTGKYLPGLLLGALISGTLGMLCVLLIRKFSRLKEDAALGIVLSVFYGLGVAVLGVIQKMKAGSSAGLGSFIYGKTASMLAGDAWLIAISAVVISCICALLYKEFLLLCFDQEFAASEGWPVFFLDCLMMGLVVAITVIGLQAVGLILMIALLIIPPASARFWTRRLKSLVIISAVIGGISGLLGAFVSAVVPRMPAGSIIVLVATLVFVISMLCGPVNGILFRLLEHARLKRRTTMQHLLRAMYENREQRTDVAEPAKTGITVTELMGYRSWSHAALMRLLRRAEGNDLIFRDESGNAHLTELGIKEAGRMVKNHRLWEIFLITHADIAPSHVDRDADQIEHILGNTMVEQLERLLEAQETSLPMPESPHILERPLTGEGRA